MSYQIIDFFHFGKSVKKLRKHHKNITQDVVKVVHILSNNPYAGDEIFENCYKLRIKNSSAHKGKSGGFRVIYYFADENKRIYLMDIYSKSNQANIEKSHLIKLLKDENTN